VRQDENFFQAAESLNTLLISFELQSLILKLILLITVWKAKTPYAVETLAASLLADLAWILCVADCRCCSKSNLPLLAILIVLRHVKHYALCRSLDFLNMGNCTCKDSVSLFFRVGAITKTTLTLMCRLYHSLCQLSSISLFTTN
jgi:hypothetical protein